jgi:hypothetical protein
VSATARLFWWVGYGDGRLHMAPVLRRPSRYVCGLARSAVDKLSSPGSRETCPRCVAVHENRPPPPIDPDDLPPAPRPPSRSSIHKTAKTTLLEGASGCERCGHQPPRKLAARVLHLHHVKPRAAGGSDDPSNLILLCANCHQLAHSLAYRRKRYWSGPEARTDFLAWMEKRLAELGE